MSLLTPAEARALTFRAASLVERRQLLSGRDVPLGNASVERLQALVRTWLQAFAPGRPEALERRLEWDGLTIEELSRVVAETHDVDGVIDAAAWTAWLDDILDVLPGVARDIATSPGALPERALFTDGAVPPFLEILTACARAATTRLRTACPAWDAAHDDVRHALTCQLLRDLAGVSDLALYARFQTWRATPRPSRGTEAYAGFVMQLLRGGLLDVWMAFPVLARHIATMLDTWTIATRELLDRAAADHAALEAMFGPLGPMRAVSPSLSDPHDGRRRVAIVTFESGTSLVYKPRDVGLEAAWASFLGWANGEGLTPPQAIVRVLARARYGWCEMATPGRFSTAEEVDAYYRVAGGLVALAYVLRARDLQMENIVATAAGPAIIDAEMLCQPTRDVEIDAEGRPRLESCLGSGLLTMAHVGPADAVFDIGGLRGDGVTPTSLGRRRWTNLGTDTLAYDDERVITSPSANRVLFQGELQDPAAHRTAVLDGFRAAYRFLLERKDRLLSSDGPLAPFAASATRVLFRPSQHYGSVQYALAGPQYQTSGVLRSCALDTLNRIFNLDDARPTLWPVVDDERHALDGLDLPRYAVPVAGTRVTSARGALDVPFFRRSGLEGVRALVEGLSDRDLARQERVIEQALANAVGRRLETPLNDRPAAGRDLSAWLLSQADALGDEILRRASPSDGEIRWLTFDAMPGRWARHAFYDGSVGAAVFLAGWARVANRDDARAAVRPAVAGLLALVESDPQSVVAEVGIGGCTGVGSLLYGLCALDALSHDATYLDTASRLAQTLTPAHAAADVTYDVTGGSAGTILGLLALHAATGDDTLVASARMFADHLLTRQLTQAAGAAWPTTRRGTPIAGFAHGSAGIALALARLAEVSGNERYRAAATRAIAHERTLFAPSLRNWPVLGALDPSTGSGHSIMTAWCHGAAGIGLARASLPTSSRDAECGSEMATALAAIDASPLTALDQICCGNLGRADILITLGQHLDRPDVVRDGVDLAGRAADRAALRQFYGLRASGVDYRVFDPGLFRGLAGIAYVLLRAARPDQLPSLLTFAPLGRHARLTP